ncbi:S1 family peptidase [Bdellovibrio svalbardensis]|uniref:Trypsin-like serine protease n=1 Tax=Bdellovibrio svalbardensis TaxID=2972972 RepID=A0ABT6DJL6_9BACT|nr:trypsin-like serine protease [Bdellovibrio svalbardensis]MDG0815283.1 trypsin-like serine protease [Bdellovibrio svalbardensis]
MKTNLLLVGSLVVFILCGCQKNSSPVTALNAQSSAIVGGTETDTNNIAGRTVAFLYDGSTKMSCTGTLISENLILTAAHCIGPNKKGITIAFGNNPVMGPYDLRNSDDIVVHDRYNKAGAEERNDLALVSFKGNLPNGFFPARLPTKSNLNIQPQQLFLALGYGRITGKKASAEGDIQGAGQLRHVGLQVDSVSADKKQFRVDQSSGVGICNGDSGGPALIKSQSDYYVVGIASAMLWTVPKELSGDEKENYLEQKDFCTEKSIYINVSEYLPWISEASKQLLNK